MLGYPPFRLLVAMLLAAAPAAHAEGRLPAYRTEVADARGTAIALYAEDTGDGAPILLLHGLGASTFTWRRVAPDLARTHRVIALDLKGFGRSDKPLDEGYKAEDQAHLVAAFIRKRGLEDLTLIGHSFGGAVAVRTALMLADEPDRIRRMVLLDAPVLPGSLPSEFDFVLVPGGPEALLGPLPPKVVAREMLVAARGTSRGITERDIEGYAAPYYELAAKHAFITTARLLVGDTDAPIGDRLASLTVSTLILWCRRDDIVPLAAGRRLARALPNATLKTFARCNHLPQEQRAGAVISAIREFLGE